MELVGPSGCTLMRGEAAYDDDIVRLFEERSWSTQRARHFGLAVVVMGMLAVGMVGHLDCYDIPCVQLVQWIPESAQERMCTGFQRGPVGQIEFMMLACLMVKCHGAEVQFSLQRGRVS